MMLEKTSYFSKLLAGGVMKRDVRLVLALLALALIPMLLMPSGVRAAAHDLADLEKSIKGKGAHWVAGETSISKLTPDAQKKRVALLKTPVSDDEHQAAAAEQSFLTTLTMPSIFDWRSATGTYAGNYVTPIRDQGNCGSCWAFATAGALESQVLMGENSPGLDVNLSEQTLVSCSSAGNCSGGYISTAADFVRDMGLPLDSCFPYTATNSTCANACANWSAADYRSAGWHWVATTAPTVDSLKSAICTYGPVVTTMDVYSDFYSYVSGVYSYVSGAYQGGHAVVIVGYNDPGQYFIVKNSWGTGWGMSGYFLMAYSQLTSAVNFGHYTIADEGYSPVGPAPACTFSISPTNKTIQSTGGTGTILASSQNNCSWTAVSNVSWISVKSGNTGSGNGSVSYTVAANPYRSQRTGTLTIAGQTFTVIQKKFGR